MNKPALVIDLDGTLIRSDLLYETLFSFLARKFLAVGLLVLACLRGKASLKAFLAEQTDLDVRLLPYNQAVLDLIKEAKADGRRVALVTASNQRLADKVAAHLGLFDLVEGSSGTLNLRGQSKAERLVALFGAGGFDYAGDSSVDLPVWRQANRAITVGASVALCRKVDRLGKDALHLPGTPTTQTRALLRAIRPHQWSKNVLIFLPAVAAHTIAYETWFALLAAFFAFCLVASSVYLLNDLLDIEADRHHPRKRHRAFAAGQVSLLRGFLLSILLLIAGFLLAYGVLGGLFVLTLVLYYAVTLGYSLYLKRKPIIDICMLAGLYTVRVFAGGVAGQIFISPWLLAFSIFLFLALAAVKREAELVDSLARGRDEIAGRGYEPRDLPIVSMMAVASGYVSVLVLALYIDSPAVQLLYRVPEVLWGLCAVLLYWISRLVMVAHRGQLDDDPIVYALKDRVSLMCGLLVLLIVTGGVWL